MESFETAKQIDWLSTIGFVCFYFFFFPFFFPFPPFFLSFLPLIIAWSLVDETQLAKMICWQESNTFTLSSTEASSGKDAIRTVISALYWKGYRVYVKRYAYIYQNIESIIIIIINKQFKVTKWMKVVVESMKNQNTT